MAEVRGDERNGRTGVQPKPEYTRTPLARIRATGPPSLARRVVFGDHVAQRAAFDAVGSIAQDAHLDALQLLHVACNATFVARDMNGQRSVRRG